MIAGAVHERLKSFRPKKRINCQAIDFKIGPAGHEIPASIRIGGRANIASLGVHDNGEPAFARDCDASRQTGYANTAERLEVGGLELYETNLSFGAIKKGNGITLQEMIRLS